jgi:hypothetical protein
VVSNAQVMAFSSFLVFLMANGYHPPMFRLISLPAPGPAVLASLFVLSLGGWSNAGVFNGLCNKTQHSRAGSVTGA